MSLRLPVLLVALTIACGGNMTVKKGEPQTAREKMLAEEKEHPSDEDAAKPPSGKSGASKKWTGWRYQGDRKDCFFVVGKKCFKTEVAACKAAQCRSPSKCETAGAGPATLTCSGAKKEVATKKEATKKKR